MGSQSVTDFSAARKKQIQSRVRDFDPAAQDAGRLAGEAGVAAMVSLKPSSAFAKALTGPSVEVAVNTLSGLVSALKPASRSVETTGEDVLAAYGVKPSDSQPFSSLAAGLRRKFLEELNASSRKTEAATAAADAIGGTVLDAIAGAFPRMKEPSEVSREKLLQALRGTPDSYFSTVFVKHLITSLLRQTFDAARGKIAPERIDELMKTVEPRIASLAARLTQVGKK